MTEGNIPNEPSRNENKVGKRWFALIIPFLTGALFYSFCTLFLYYWSQGIEEARRLTTDFLSPFSEDYSINLVFFVIGFLAGLLPTVVIFISARKNLGRNLIVSIVISGLILIFSFCGCSWVSMWLINP